MLQLDPPIPVETPKGSAWSIGWIDYGPDHDLLWICFIRSTRECWTFRNQDIRQVFSLTYQRGLTWALGVKSKAKPLATADP